MSKKENKQTKNLKTVAAVLGCILVLLVGLLIWLEYSNQNDDNRHSEEVLCADICIATPYGNLKYPCKWSQYLLVDEYNIENNLISFSAKLEGKDKQKLFDVCFDSDCGSVAGYIQSEEGRPVRVSIISYELFGNYSAEEQAILYAMQEEVNYLTDNMTFLPEEILEEPEESIQETTEPVVHDSIVIETPVVSLEYNGKWAEYLKYSQTFDDACSTMFYCIMNNVEYPLFSISFSSTTVSEWGAIETPDGEFVYVTVEMYPLDQFSEVTDKELAILQGMQDDVNYTLQRLEIVEEPDLVVEETITATERPETEVIVEVAEDLVIETPYGQLYYPGKWRDKVRFEGREATGAYIVEFQAILPGKNAEFLFSIGYGGEKENAMTILTIDGNQVPFYVIAADISTLEGWKQGEIDVLYEMQEDINYLLERLPHD